MAVGLDIGIVVILILTCIIGYVRGFKRYFIGIVAAVIATAAAALGSAALAEPVYDRYVRDEVNRHVQSAVADFDPTDVIMEKLSEHGLGGYATDEEVAEALSRGGDYLQNVGDLLSGKGVGGDEVADLQRSVDSYFGEFPAVVKQRLEEHGLSQYVDSVDISAQELREFIDRVNTQGMADAADYVVEKAVKPVLVGIIRSLLFGVCYIAVMLLLQLIIFISGAAQTSSELKAADRFAGLALGAIKGLLYCAVIAWVLSVLCSATKNSFSVFNAGVSEQTYLFRYFFDFFYK